MPALTGTKYANSDIHTFLNLPSHDGSGAFVVDQDTGELVERTAYMPYGGIDADMRSYRWAYSREDLKFGGQWDEAEMGLVYMGARYYSPQLARFISPDPLAIHGLAGDPNPYEYANGSPLRYTDSTGLDGEDQSTPTANASDESNASDQANATFENPSLNFLLPPVGDPIRGLLRQGDTQVDISEVKWSMERMEAEAQKGLQAEAEQDAKLARIFAQRAITKVVAYYNIDRKGYVAKNGLDNTPNYFFHPELSDDAVSHEDPQLHKLSDVWVGPSAFERTPGWLGSILAHESEGHGSQAHNKTFARPSVAGPRYPEAHDLNELDAYHREYTQAARFGLSEEDINTILDSWNDFRVLLVGIRPEYDKRLPKDGRAAGNYHLAP
jgi:RHS repeat-associated protein